MTPQIEPKLSVYATPSAMETTIQASWHQHGTKYVFVMSVAWRQIDLAESPSREWDAILRMSFDRIDVFQKSLPR